MFISNSKNYLSIYIVTSFYIGALLFGQTQYYVFGLNTSLNDYFLVLWIFLLLTSKYNLTINYKYIKFEIILLIFFMIYAGIETLYGMYGSKSLTLYMQLLQSFLIFMLVFYFIQKATITEVNTLIFKFAFWMSLLMIVLYFLFLKFSYLPINIFEYGEFQSIRFEGFAEDANFYAFLMSVAFLIGSYSSCKDLNIKFKILYLLPIGINIVITVSRSVIASLIVSFILGAFLFERNLQKKLKRLFLFIVIVISFILLSMIELPLLNLSIYDWYSMRATQGSPRFEFWMILYDYFLEQPLFGYGLRASEVLLGGFGHYAHSSYVELFIDYGIFGTIIFLSFMLLVYNKGMKLIKLNQSYKPWIQSYIIICILFAGFTLLYWAFMWTIMAIILGGYTFEKNRLNNNIVQ